MGFGPFSSESRTRVTTTSSAFNTGFSEIAGPATSINVNVTGGGKKSATSTVINLTDQGAIKAAQSISEQSTRQVELFSGTVAEAIAGALAAVRGSSDSAVAAVLESQRGEVENIGLSLVKWGALAFAVYALARVFWKGA